MKNASSSFVLVLLAAASLSACVAPMPTTQANTSNPPYYADDMSTDSVPRGANIILVHKAGISPDSLLSEIFEVLIERRHRVVIDNPARRYIATEGVMLYAASFAVGRIVQRMSVSVRPKGSGAEARIYAEWRRAMYSSDQNLDDWTEARWDMPVNLPMLWGTVNRGSAAFTEALQVAEAISGGQISYEVAKPGE